MSNNLYETLWVDKSASGDEIKKAYRKKAMKYHPDRNTWDATAETKFKEVNAAYDTLGDTKKKQQYDTFGSTGGSPFGGWAGAGQGFWGFEDMFGWGRQQQQAGGFEFNMEDLFGGQSQSSGWFGRQQQKQQAKKPESMDFEKTYEVPIFDIILGCSIEVRGVYGNTAKLKIPAKTQPGTKFRVKWLWKKEPGREGNLIVVIKALMPKHISDVDMQMLERIRENIGY